MNECVDRTARQLAEDALEENTKVAATIKDETLRAIEAEVLNSTSLGIQTKNLLLNGCSSTTVQGVTITVNEDKSMTLNGTNTGGSVLAFPNMQTGATSAAQQYVNNKKWIPNGKYIASLTDIESSIAGVVLQIRGAINPNDAGTLLGSVSSAQTTIEVTEEYNYVWTRLLISAGASFDNITIYPMIRPVEIKDKTYEEYKPSLQTQINDLLSRIEALEAYHA